MQRGENMKIAVTYDNGLVGQHFGQTSAFQVFTIENGSVTDEKIISTNGKGHRELIPVVRSLGVDVMICGGLGTPMADAISQMGIQLCAGVSGDCRKAVQDYLNGTLSMRPDAVHECHH